MSEEIEKIDLSMYGVAEIIKWCVTRNKGRVPGADTLVFQQMQEALKEKPASNDYFTLDQFWKSRRIFEFSQDDVATVNQCLYDIPNFDGEQNPQIRYKFWPKVEVQK